jgi:transmembrane sensor
VYRTTHGEQRIVQLPDGSMMHINTDSAVTVRYTQSERLASIDQGEAFFEVKPQPTRPFRVVADSLSAVAVGTQFDVYRHGAVTAVTVVVGHVAVLTGVPSRARVDAALRVGPGEQVRVVGGTIPATATSVDLRHSVGWLHRQIAFDQQPLATVAAEFNRYVPVPLVIDDPELMAVRVSGVFDPYNTEAFVAFLTTLDGVSVERTPAMIRVHRVRPGTRVR